MAKRIYTKTGDDGTTGLFGGARLPKHHVRIEAYGSVDELNSFIGWLINYIKAEETSAMLQVVQSRLFTVGSNLASDPDKEMITPDLMDEDILMIEKSIDQMQAELPELRHFILPGGSQAVAVAHLARTVCRRAERRCVALAYESQIDPVIILFLNRLSDYFFVLARWIGYHEGIDEIKWVPRK